MVSCLIFVAEKGFRFAILKKNNFLLVLKAKGKHVLFHTGKDVEEEQERSRIEAMSTVNIHSITVVNTNHRREDNSLF